MKIDEAVSKNLAFWQDQVKSIQKQIGVQVADVERLQGVLVEANKQVVLYTKAGELLTALEAQPTTAEAGTVEVAVSDTPIAAPVSDKQ
jgi:hypothetical protein